MNRDLVARILLGIAAAGAAVSAVTAIGALADASDATKVVEAWRMLAYIVFAGLFVLLAWRPRGLPGVWELAIAHKAGIALLAATFGAATDAVAVRWIDGVLAVLLVVAYVLARGYGAWRRVPAVA